MKQNMRERLFWEKKESLEPSIQMYLGAKILCIFCRIHVEKNVDQIEIVEREIHPREYYNPKKRTQS
jgi:hypothetical protein